MKWEIDSRKGMIENVIRRDERSSEGTVQDQSRNLQETDLKGVCGANLHREGDIAVHRKGDRILI